MTKGRRQHQPTRSRSSVSECDGEDSFIFEANEAWKDFHSSLLRFYENGELCDVTLKVRPSFRTARKMRVLFLHRLIRCHTVPSLP